MLNALLAGSDSAQINNLHTASNVIVTQWKTSQVRQMYHDQHIENFYSPSAGWLKNYTHEMGWFTQLHCLLARIRFCQSDILKDVCLWNKSDVIWYTAWHTSKMKWSLDNSSTCNHFRKTILIMIFSFLLSSLDYFFSDNEQSHPGEVVIVKPILY